MIHRFERTDSLDWVEIDIPTHGRYYAKRSATYTQWRWYPVIDRIALQQTLTAYQNTGWREITKYQLPEDFKLYVAIYSGFGKTKVPKKKKYL